MSQGGRRQSGIPQQQSEHDERRSAQVGGECGHAARAIHVAQGRKRCARVGQPQQDRPDAGEAKRAAHAKQNVPRAAQSAEQTVRELERGEQAAAHLHKWLPHRERPVGQAVGHRQRQAEEAGTGAGEAKDKRAVSAQRGRD